MKKILLLTLIFLALFAGRPAHQSPSEDEIACHVNATAVTDGTQTAIIAADADNDFRVTDVSVSNTGATASVIWLKVGSTNVWPMIGGAGSGYTHGFHTPINVPSGTALNFQSVETSGVSLFVAVCGYTVAE